MRSNNPEERIRVRVNYVSRGYGLALTIEEDEEAAAADQSAPDTDDTFDYLTVVESGVTTLELRRPDGESSYLIWDESEVAWDSLLAG